MFVELLSVIVSVIVFLNVFGVRMLCVVMFWCRRFIMVLFEWWVK